MGIFTKPPVSYILHLSIYLPNADNRTIVYPLHRRAIVQNRWAIIIVIIVVSAARPGADGRKFPRDRRYNNSRRYGVRGPVRDGSAAVQLGKPEEINGFT